MDVECGDLFSIFKRKDESLFFCGKISSLIHSNVPKFLIQERITQISCGSEHCLILVNNNQVLSLGENKFGELGTGDLKFRTEFTIILREETKSIGCGNYFSLVLYKNEELLSFGNNDVVKTIFHFQN